MSAYAKEILQDRRAALTANNIFRADALLRRALNPAIVLSPAETAKLCRDIVEGRQ